MSDIEKEIETYLMDNFTKYEIAAMLYGVLGQVTDDKQKAFSYIKNMRKSYDELIEEAERK